MRAAGFVEIAADAQAAAGLFEVRAAEQFADQFPHERHPGLAADENDLVQILGLQFCVRERPQAMRPGAADDVARQVLQLAARELVIEGKVRRQKGQGDFNLGFAG